MPGPEGRRLDDLIAEAQRIFAICNACRYCEGYCATFPALERRLSFGEADAHYLANLCHNCGSCLYACQYAPPHEFQLNFPRTMAQVRAQTYRKYAWPGAAAPLFARNGAAVSAAMAIALVLGFAFIAGRAGGGRFVSAWSDAQGSFYALFAHRAMVWIFGPVFAAALAVLAAGFVRFWRDTGERVGELAARPSAEAAHDAFTLKYLGGGGEGCRYPDEKPSFLRRRFHHLTFYGFLLCFAATCVATIYHYVFGWKAPYPFLSVPVVLGTLGGIGLVVGPAGLLWLKEERDSELVDRQQTGMDVAFLVLLFLTGLTGLLLLAFRETAAMGSLLAIHLGMVLATFVTMPYGKLVHAIYRLAALARYHVERRRALPDVAAE
ncbi:MAG TPA: tricarballylate utilization 4Fe-4S protein TcuB [Usitatibacter sp.]|nr:tricarballylate utilization 4Fe-4S protein TcuB [Usitatibacter sp.]